MKRVSHQDSLQLKPLFRNCDCTHETCLQQLLPLVFKGGKRFSLGCLFFLGACLQALVQVLQVLATWRLV